MRWGILSNGEIGKKTLTNKNNGEEKLHYCTKESKDSVLSGVDKSQEKLDFSELDKEFENG